VPVRWRSRRRRAAFASPLSESHRQPVSRDDFAALLGRHPIDDQVRFDNFAENGKVDWARVAAAVTASRIGNRRIAMSYFFRSRLESLRGRT
jgi:hypothetical protein